MRGWCKAAGRRLSGLPRIFLLFMAAVSLPAQPQIGGGACNSASLNGNYALTLAGRDVGQTATLSLVSVGVGTATFDGLSKLTLTFTPNTGKGQGTTQTWSGTYSMQVNCVGTLTITSGNSATFTVESYNQGRDYLITGQDGTYAYTASGSLLPTTCTPSQLNGSYSFNGNGFTTTSAGAISGVSDFSGVMQFNGAGTVTSTWYVSAGGSTQMITASGSYSVNSNCAGTTTMTDNAGNKYALTVTQTSTVGNFSFGGASPQFVFTGTGRPL
jgi:hypothetical protein